MTNLESKKALARKLDIDYATIASNELFSDADLQEFIQFALSEVWDMHPWPFTELTETFSADAQGVSDGFYDFPAEMMLGSVRRLAVANKEFYGPIRFEDYLKHFENDPTSTEKIWSFHEMFLFINANAYSIGDAIDVLGKEIAPTLSADGDLLPFSPISDDQEHSGNMAIVELAYAYALASEKMKRTEESELVRKTATRTLEILWKPFSQFKSLQQAKDRPMFNMPDQFGGNGRGTSPIGNFNL